MEFWGRQAILRDLNTSTQLMHRGNRNPSDGRVPHHLSDRKDGDLRGIDESGEDYFFSPIASSQSMWLPRFGHRS
jgi:hypothetical protein